jgi:hypothetical protein
MGENKIQSPFAPLPPIMGENKIQSPPELGDLGGLSLPSKIIRSTTNLRSQIPDNYY